jgi:EAL domain-containing protein (putative c-di-GMP-specific phosphodiesterase class I)
VGRAFVVFGFVLATVVASVLRTSLDYRLRRNADAELLVDGLTLRARGDSGVTTNPAASPVSALLERDRLQRFYPALVILTLLFGSAEASSGVLLREPTLGAAGASTFLFAIGLIIAGSQLRRGRADRARIAVAISLTLFGALGTFLIAGLGLAMALLPLLSAILVLPYVVRPQLIALSVAALSSTAGILAIGAAPHVFPEIGGDAGRVFEGAIFLGVVALVLAAVADFAIDSRESVLFLGALHDRRTHETAARLGIVASLRALEEQATPEATAALIIGSMSGQPLIDVALLLEDTDAGLVVLAAAGPAEHPIEVGEIVPSVRARYLLARSARGAWAELWSERPVPGFNDELMSRLGIKGQAFAPVVVGDQVVGLIAIATTDAEEALHLVEDLPLVSELAALADKILAPALLARHNLRRERAAMASMIAAGGFSPVFQPVVDLATGVRVGFEALTRFASGDAPSDVFLDAARIGLGVELETATLAVAVRASAGLPANAWLSLNVSAELLGHSNALGPLLAHEVRPLILEVTEHEVIDDYEALHRALGRLGRDVRLATDDAGAGVANFRHLINLRAHMVKIDVAVVRGVDTDVSRQAVIAGLVHFAAVSGALILAEGIETKAEAETVKRLGVRLGQGYLLGRPAPVGHWRVRPAGRTPRRPIRISRARPATPVEIAAAPAGA